MFPISDVIPSRTVPFVTVGLIIANALVFLYMITLPDAMLERFVATYAVVPAWFSVPTLFTSQFLHAGWMHIIGNMLYLWIFGDNVEDRLGHFRYLLFYLGAGALAAILQVLFNPFSAVPMLGASGAIAGVMGAYFVLARRNRWDTSAIAALIVVNLVISFASPNIDWRAHVGGLVVGAAVGYGLARTMERRRRPAVSAAAGVAVFAAAVIPLVLLSLLPPGHA